MRRHTHAAIDIAVIALGILSAAFGLKGFLLSSHFIDGGVTGVSMLISNVFGVPLALLIPVINLPFIALGYKQVGARFAAKSAAAIAALALCLAFVHFPDVTPDKLLTAVFGGFFIGAGIGLAIRGGAVLDGTEVAALLVSKRSALLRVGDVILILNPLIFSAAAFFLMSGGSEGIRQAIIRDLGRGVTVYKGRRGWTDAEQDILYCVVTRLEIGRVKGVVEGLGAAALVAVHPLSDVSGGVIKKPALH